MATLTFDDTKITRFEVIDEDGRSLVFHAPEGKKGHVFLSVQDDDRTLKVFLDRKPAKTKQDE